MGPRSSRLQRPLGRVARTGVGDRRMRRLYQRPARRGERHAGRVRARRRRVPDPLGFDCVRRDDERGRRCDPELPRRSIPRFEARIGQPANARTTTNFERFQTAALKAALGWDAGKSRSVLRSMSGDASEYLAASRQRGDVYVAGKTRSTSPAASALD